MTPPDDRPPNVERLDWRLTELEQKVDRGFTNIEHRFDRLGNTLDQLAYVPKELYRSEQTAQDVAIANVAQLVSAVEKRMNDRVDGTDRVIHWTLGLLISSLIAALGAGLVRLAVA